MTCSRPPDPREGLTIVLITRDIGIVNKDVTRSPVSINARLSRRPGKEFYQSDVFRNMVSRGDHLIAHEH